MTHRVTGLIAEQSLLTTFSAQKKLCDPISLLGDLAILPLRDADIEALLPGSQSICPEGFLCLSEQLASMLCEMSRAARLMYFETEYFGGAGTQGAVVYAQGACVFGPAAAGHGPINRALALLGVQVQAPAHDEFETVGLHRHRSSMSWIENDERGRGVRTR